MSAAAQPATARGRAVRPGRAASLTRDQVARAALEIADRDGIDALSMRRLAEALEVGTMTLYGYFRGKQELLDGVVDAAVEGPEPVPAEGPWRERLQQLVQGARRRLVRHPALVQIRLRQPVLRPEALRFGETALGILIEAGLPRLEAAQSFRLLFTYLFGFAGVSPAETTDEARRAAAAALAGLPPNEYPNMTSAAREMSHAMAGEDQFAYGLERILDGIEARVRA